MQSTNKDSSPWEVEYFSGFYWTGRIFWHQEFVQGRFVLPECGAGKKMPGSLMYRGVGWLPVSRNPPSKFYFWSDLKGLIPAVSTPEGQKGRKVHKTETHNMY